MAWKIKQEFNKTLVSADFGLSADVDCKAGIWTQFGLYDVPSQQAVCFGARGIAPGVDDRGISYLDLKTPTPAALNGLIRYVVADRNLVTKVVIDEFRTEVARASQYDRTQAKMQGRDGRFAMEDSYLLLEFLPDGSSDVTLSATNSTIRVPVTVQYGEKI